MDFKKGKYHLVQMEREGEPIFHEWDGKHYKRFWGNVVGKRVMKADFNWFEDEIEHLLCDGTFVITDKNYHVALFIKGL